MTAFFYGLVVKILFLEFYCKSLGGNLLDYYSLISFIYSERSEGFSYFSYLRNSLRIILVNKDSY